MLTRALGHVDCDGRLNYFTNMPHV